MAEEIIDRYFKDYTNISFQEYIRKYIHVTTIPQIKRTNKTYRRILHELCTTGTADFWQEEDLVVFFNWDICYDELFRNFGIIW